jgi:hypothetical protein
LQAHTDGQVFRDDGKLIEARERWLRCAQNDCPPAIIDDCAGWLPALESSIPTAVFAISDARGHDVIEARVSDQHGKVIAERADGRAVQVNPGIYDFQISAPGLASATERVVVRESEKNRIVRVELAPEVATEIAHSPRPDDSRGMKPIPTASWLLGGTALASGIVVGVSGLLYLSARHEIRTKRCMAGDAPCEQDRRDIANRGKTYTLIDQIAGPVAGVALITAIVVYAVSEPPSDRAEAERLHWQAAVSPSSAGLRLQGHF